MTPKRTLYGLILIITALVMSYLASIEYFGISRDVEEYRNFFNTVENYKGRFEIFFVITTKTLKEYFGQFSLFLFLITFFSLLIKFGVLYNFRFYITNLFLYICILYATHELTQYRVSIALALLYSAFLCKFYNRFNLLSWMLFSIGSLFHYSTLAFLPIMIGWNYLKTGFSIKVPLALAMLGLFLVLKPGIISLIVTLNPTLSESFLGLPGNPFSSRNLILISVVILGVLNWKKLEPDVRPYYFISVYGFILWIIFYNSPVFSHRLFEMTFFAYFIWVSCLRGIYRQIAYTLLLILAAYLNYRQLYIEPYFS